MRSLADVAADSGVEFGTSGARGLVERMSAPVCAAYVRAFLSVVGGDGPVPRVALGIDLRPSSAGIAAACAAALNDGGTQVDYCGVLPTPALALHAMREGVPAIMVTGSHIPFDRNGLKFYRPQGEITKADETAMRAVPVKPHPTHMPLILPSCNPRALRGYASRYMDAFPAGMLEGRRVGVYEHSSAARDVLVEVLHGLGAEVIALGRTDTFVPIDTEAVSPEDEARGRAWAMEHRFDAIVSTDGDGDRPLLGDEHGAWLRGDLVGLVCARYLGLEAVAVPVSCNTAIEASRAFGHVVRTRIGSPHVIAAMESLAKGGYRVGGFEANGGFLLGSPVEMNGRTLEPLPTRDAILPALAVMAAAQAAGTTLSALMAHLPGRFTHSDRIQDFTTARSSDLIAQWAREPRGLLSAAGLERPGLAAMDHTDGLRLTSEDGEIIHLRPSGNAPELRCYCEAASPIRARQLVASTMRHLLSVKG
jgi:phosphomannomutase